MKIITEPSVYLLGQSQINDQELDRFLADNDISSWTTDTDVGGEKLIEIAGRACYWSFAKPRPGGNKGYIDHILEVGHGSVLEHSVFTLLFSGVSRSLTHELVRHRAGMGYSQLSQRYVDESDTDFVVPPMINDLFEWGLREANEHQRVTAGIYAEFTRAVREAQKSYQRLADSLDGMLALTQPHLDRTARRKAAREAARSVLPNATETKIVVTGNARALRHFIEMRGDVAADAEIRRLAVAVLKVLQAASPNLFGDYQLGLTNGQEFTSTPYTKV